MTKGRPALVAPAALKRLPTTEMRQLNGCADALAICESARAHKGLTLVITQSTSEAIRWAIHPVFLAAHDEDGAIITSDGIAYCRFRTGKHLTSVFTPGHYPGRIPPAGYRHTRHSGSTGAHPDAPACPGYLQVTPCCGRARPWISTAGEWSGGSRLSSYRQRV